jgi:hypothetical protein
VAAQIQLLLFGNGFLHRILVQENGLNAMFAAVEVI